MSNEIMYREGSKEIRRSSGSLKVGVIRFFAIGRQSRAKNKERELMSWLNHFGAFNVLPGVRVKEVAKASVLPFIHQFEIEVDLSDAIVGF